jgi:hypothetical protein
MSFSFFFWFFPKFFICETVFFQKNEKNDISKHPINRNSNSDAWGASILRKYSYESTCLSHTPTLESYVCIQYDTSKNAKNAVQACLTAYTFLKQSQPRNTNLNDVQGWSNESLPLINTLIHTILHALLQNAFVHLFSSFFNPIFTNFDQFQISFKMELKYTYIHNL